MTTQAAELAEELGELALAEQYAERFLARGGADCTPAFAHALLARGAASRGDRPAAVKRWPGMEQTCEHVCGAPLGRTRRPSMRSIPDGVDL